MMGAGLRISVCKTKHFAMKDFNKLSSKRQKLEGHCTYLNKKLSETREELSQAQDEISNTNDEALETNNLLTDRINKRSEVIKQLREHNATLKTNLEEPKSNTCIYHG